MPIELSTPPVPISFEVYPPRTDAGWSALYETIRRLAEVQPRFISVTFGAGGSSGGRSLDLLRHILHSTSVQPLAHLTCVGNTYAGANALIREFLDAGITSFLALRGDPPAGVAWRGTWPRPCSAIRRRALSVISLAMPADCQALAAA